MNHMRIPFFHKELSCLPFLLGPVYLLVCFLLLVGVSFCRYTTGTGGSDSARAAAWDVEVTYTGDSLEQTMVRPSDDGVKTVSYPFTVTSHSETALQYDLELLLANPLPDGVTAELDGTPITFSDCKCTVPNAGVLAAGSNVSKQHTLSFMGDFSTITPGTDQNIPITITVQAEQID